MPSFRPLYYRLFTSDNSTVSNGSMVHLVSSITSYVSDATYGNRRMMTKDGTPNDDTIYFYGATTPGKKIEDGWSLPSLFSENLTIRTKTGSISANAVYENPATDYITQTSKVEFTVTGAIGEFEGAKSLTIFYDNTNYTRRIEIN